MYLWDKEVEIDAMKGIIFDKIEKSDTEILFYENSVERFRMEHQQNCCESVYVEDVCGDLSDLIGCPILEAECVTDTESPKSEDGYTDESSTWTFYKLGTTKGHVTIRWYGSSNGYYGEGVDIFDMTKQDEE